MNRRQLLGVPFVAPLMPMEQDGEIINPFLPDSIIEMVKHQKRDMDAMTSAGVPTREAAERAVRIFPVNSYGVK